MRGGWFGDSKGHSLAARGIRLYQARKGVLVDPIFYGASKREEQLPTFQVYDMARSGKTFDQMRAKYPDADPEDVRKKGIRAIDSMHGNNDLSTMDSSGVDTLVKMAKEDSRMKERMLKILSNEQQSSFLQLPKRRVLDERLRMG